MGWTAQLMAPRNVLRFAGAVLLTIGALALYVGYTTPAEMVTGGEPRGVVGVVTVAGSSSD